MESLLRKNNIMFHEKERKIKAILKDESNNKCIDCQNSKTEYISLNNACFICKTCFKRHQKFPLSISKTIKNNLKSLTLKELQYLYFGGNKKLLEFMKYEYPKLIQLSPSFAYKTIAMEYYRSWLKYLIEGGNKPQKPDIEIAYKSIEDKEYLNKNYLNNNNNDDNVITIDFFNDCYNYNDKYNHSITNFINKKNNKTNGNMNNKMMYDSGKNFFPSKNDNNEIKNFLNHYKDLNKDNYNKYINTQTLDMFSHTQNNFLPKRNNFDENMKINTLRKKYRDKSTEDIEVINNNNEPKTIRNNDNKNIYNDKIIREFKTNNRIYVKKHNLVKSLENIPTNEQNNKVVNEEKNKIKEIYINRNKDQENNHIDTIKVKVKIGVRESKLENNKENNKENNEKILEKMKLNKKFRNIGLIGNKDNLSQDYFTTDNNNLGNYNELNKPSKENLKAKLTKKIYNHKLNELNYKIDNKGKNENIDKKEKNENNIITSLAENYQNSKVFKKKSLKNSFFTNNEKKISRNRVEHSQFEIISKNKINNTQDETNENRNYEESNDDSISVNTTRTFILNKSMKHFYSRYPRKMNRTKTKRRKLNDSKIEEKKEKKKLQKLKREKSEIIQSLKLLLKKKDELEKKENENTDEEEENESEEKSEEYNIKNKNKTNNNRKEKSIFNKKENNKEKIMPKENKKKKRGDDSEKENNYEEEKEYKHKNNYKEEKKKKIYVHQSQDFSNKEPEKESFRAKYKKKNYKYSEI